eukprot:TRINITY_DN10419_c0_g1_i1.p1 TRINITY_DN10419_c0_g1~~TRINITY_DN10419_c0_g1_i1.p1  ORF type:complete len:493 (+),score=98.44 TRINITY_DN10419_c0_g1_i1:1555-3033(+)
MQGFFSSVSCTNELLPPPTPPLPTPTKFQSPPSSHPSSSCDEAVVSTQSTGEEKSIGHMGATASSQELDGCDEGGDWNFVGVGSGGVGGGSSSFVQLTEEKKPCIYGWRIVYRKNKDATRKESSSSSSFTKSTKSSMTSAPSSVTPLLVAKQTDIARIRIVADGGSEEPVPLQLACGHDHALILTVEGQVFSLGNSPGNGFGNKEPLLQPTNIASSAILSNLPSHTPIMQIQAGKSYSALLYGNGDVYCFGASSNLIPINLSNLSQLENIVVHRVEFPFSHSYVVAQIAGGANHMAAVTNTGQLFTWGASSEGQLGYLTQNRKSQTTPKEVNLDGNKAIQVQCGSAHTVVMLESNKLAAWGRNEECQIGVPKSTPVLRPSFLDIPSLSSSSETPTIVFAGGFCTAIITSLGKGYVWGKGEGHVPTLAAHSGKVIKFALSKDYNLILTDENKVMFWTTSEGLCSLKPITGLPSGVSQIACGDIGYMMAVTHAF